MSPKSVREMPLPPPPPRYLYLLVSHKHGVLSADLNWVPGWMPDCRTENFLFRPLIL